MVFLIIKTILKHTTYYIFKVLSCRVAQLGKLKDWLLIRNIYDDEKLKKVIMNMRYLDKKSLHFYAQIFGRPIEKLGLTISGRQVGYNLPFD